MYALTKYLKCELNLVRKLIGEKKKILLWYAKKILFCGKERDIFCKYGSFKGQEYFEL